MPTRLYSRRLRVPFLLRNQSNVFVRAMCERRLPTAIWMRIVDYWLNVEDCALYIVTKRVQGRCYALNPNHWSAPLIRHEKEERTVKTRIDHTPKEIRRRAAVIQELEPREAFHHRGKRQLDYNRRGSK